MSEDRRAWEVVAQANDKAKDVLDLLPPRRRLGERTLHRIGRRAWERPNVAVSARLYSLYRLPDPWDPNQRSEAVESIRLGPVSLRLGEERRIPAPHLKPKAPKKNKKNNTNASRQGNLPPGFKPPSGVPSARQTNNGLPPGFKPPRGVPNAKTTSSYKPPKPPPRPTPSREFGGKKNRRLVGKIPMRPDLAKKPGGKPAPRASPPPASRPPVPSASPPKAEASKSTWLPPGFKPPRGVPDAKKSATWSPPEPPSRPSIAGEFGKARAHRLVGKLPVRPDMSKSSGAAAPASGEPASPVSRRAPMPAAAAKKRRGRFRMAPRQTSSAPVITEVSEPVAVPVKAEPAPAQRPVRPATAGGLDDLFGFAAQEGRMRLGGSKKKE